MRMKVKVKMKMGGKGLGTFVGGRWNIESGGGFLALINSLSVSLQMQVCHKRRPRLRIGIGNGVLSLFFLLPQFSPFF